MADEDNNYKCGPEQDYFTPDAGIIKGPVHCGVCGDKMEEKRNVYGPRGFAMAMSGSKELHDTFWCPNRNSVWHIQVVKLRKMARECPSAKLAKMLLEEANDVVTSRAATKEDGLWRVL